jgi:HlyD family secretion protein
MLWKSQVKSPNSSLLEKVNGKPKNKTTSDEEIDLVSEELDEVIGRHPNWLLRTGISIITGILAILIVVSYFIKYPDIIEAPMKLNAVNGPKLITNTVEGKLAKLLVKDQQWVKKGQALAWLQTPVNYEQAFTLKTWTDDLIKAIDRNGPQSLKNKPIPQLDQLGELQFTYQDFSKTYFETLDILKDGYYEKKKKSLRLDIFTITEMSDNIKKTEDILKRDYEVTLNDYSINEHLYEEKAVSKVAFNLEKSKRLNKEATLSEIQSKYISNTASLNAKNQELQDIEKVVNDQWHLFKFSLLSLSSQLDKWIKTYIIFAPENGRVQYVGFLEESQWIKMNQDIFYVVPSNTSYYGEALVSQYRLGKLKIGQKTIIKFESFPQEEFGIINGTVDYISNIPDKNGNFVIKIAMSSRLRTDMGKQIQFKNQLAANVQIITSKERLLMKLINRILVLLKSNK